MKIADKIFSIVCDDIREELGNKLSLIGLYQDEIAFDNLPAILPKLAFVVFLEDIKKTLPDVTLKSYAPDHELRKITIKKPTQSQSKKSILNFFMSPVRCHEAGELIFELYFGKEKSPTYTRKLKIREIDDGITKNK